MKLLLSLLSLLAVACRQTGALPTSNVNLAGSTYLLPLNTSEATPTPIVDTEIPCISIVTIKHIKYQTTDFHNLTYQTHTLTETNMVHYTRTKVITRTTEVLRERSVTNDVSDTVQYTVTDTKIFNVQYQATPVYVTSTRVVTFTNSNTNHHYETTTTTIESVLTGTRIVHADIIETDSVIVTLTKTESVTPDVSYVTETTYFTSSLSVNSVPSAVTSTIIAKSTLLVPFIRLVTPSHDIFFSSTTVTTTELEPQYVTSTTVVVDHKVLTVSESFYTISTATVTKTSEYVSFSTAIVEHNVFHASEVTKLLHQTEVVSSTRVLSGGEPVIVSSTVPNTLWYTSSRIIDEDETETTVHFNAIYVTKSPHIPDITSTVTIDVPCTEGGVGYGYNKPADAWSWQSE